MYPKKSLYPSVLAPFSTLELPIRFIACMGTENPIPPIGTASGYTITPSCDGQQATGTYPPGGTYIGCRGTTDPTAPTVPTVPVVPVVPVVPTVPTVPTFAAADPTEFPIPMARTEEAGPTGIWSMREGAVGEESWERAASARPWRRSDFHRILTAFSERPGSC